MFPSAGGEDNEKIPLSSDPGFRSHVHFFLNENLVDL